MGTKQKVSSIKDKLHKLERQLKEIQNSCTHKTKSIKFISLNKGTRWVCDDCQIQLGFPNKKEIQSWVYK